MVVSMAFGGPDMQDLYVVTGDKVERPLKGTRLKMRSDIPDLPVPRRSSSLKRNKL
jgi:hypothetical protein